MVLASPSSVSMILGAASNLNKRCCGSAGSSSIEFICSSCLYSNVSYKEKLDMRCPFSINGDFD